MNSKIPIIIIISLLFVGCSSEKVDFEKLDESLRFYCEKNNDGLVINSKEDFNNNNCKIMNNIDGSIQNNTIDYENYTLISNFASGSGCSTTFEESIIKNNQDKKIIYTIDITRNRRVDCDNIVGGGGTYLIPKISQDFEVEFRVEQSKSVMYYLTYWIN